MPTRRRTGTTAARATTRWGLRLATALAAALLPLAAGAPAGAHPAHQQPAGAAQPLGPGVAPLLGNLGPHHHRVTVATELAQRYFDEGLILAYGFNHAEAIRSFRDAATLDPQCAMCYWGVALALGPNINAPMEAGAVPAAYAALQQAAERAPRASPAEQDYIRALAARYAVEPVEDRSGLDRAYADAMRDLAHRYPDDLDAATLFAEALMDLSPWTYWTKDGQPTDSTPEIVATLESVLARDPEHPGANHFYVHAVEASPAPERALPSAGRLERLVPGAGHLVHMPAHTYWRVGRYADAARVNEHAIHVDEAAFEAVAPDRGTASYYGLAYYPHNVHFLFAAAQMQGRSAVALEAARKLAAVVPAEGYRDHPGLEEFRPMPLFALVRFGRWEAILQEPPPGPEYAYSTGVWHWARGLAYVRQGRLDLAAEESAALAAAAQAPEAQDLALWSSFAPAPTVLELAGHVLAGELAGARHQPDEQLAELEAAAGLQDDLPYTEPPWSFPIRHYLGAALLAAGRPAEAEAVYREDLRQHPDNGWSLFGLAESLRAQGDAPAAADAQRRFEAVWRDADVALSASRY
jgi:tetratricopeptide (TPR) repeat protein